ncbi:MAG TPA: dTMP kinase [Candidatus Bathyarchaeia archaeon]|nr:dTMP kinase [Candidatus Bathyarchaeia archaeon]
MKARLITFEGIEGSGKTVVSNEAARALERAGLDVKRVREPGGTVVSEAIRSLLLDPARREIDARTELFLYLASRAQLVSEVIRPALAAGRTVVCDRYLDASVAYQGWARGLGEELVRELNAAAVGDALPDRTFLLDCPVAVGLERGPEKREADGVAARDRLEREDVPFHEKVREGYLRLAKREKGRVVVVDASRPLPEVIAAVFGNLERLFSVRLTA